MKTKKSIDAVLEMQRGEKSKVEKMGKCLYDPFYLVLYYYIEYAGRRVFAFATSGGSGIGKTAEKLKPYLKRAEAIRQRKRGWEKERISISRVHHRKDTKNDLHRKRYSGRSGLWL